MADQDQGDSYPFDKRFSTTTQTAKAVTMTTASPIISPAPRPAPRRANASVSIPSPLSAGTQSNSYDDVDISHVKLSAAGRFYTSSPIEGTNLPRLSRLLPGILRTGQMSPISPSKRLSDVFSKDKGGSYEAVSPSEELTRKPSWSRTGSVSSSASSSGSKRVTPKRRSSVLSPSQGTIPEEDFDMSLLKSAMPMGEIKTTEIEVESDQNDLPVVTPTAAGFDISSFTGPFNPSEAQMNEIKRQEAAGILTGGLGAGWKPDTTIKSSDLMANMPQTHRSSNSRRTSMSLPRRMSFRNPGVSRSDTLRDLGQNEANKRGEIIEVIMENSPVDISSLNGESTTNGGFDSIKPFGSSNRNASFKTTEVFYPQANWKPFSMRWPYLTMLIVVSVVLAASQEYMYQKARKKPLFQFNSPGEIKTWDYFCFKYLPTAVAVTFGVLWQVTDFEVKRLEAYYQLSRDGGALAAESINVDYITFFNFLRPARAIQFKHYAVAVSSMATLLAVSLVPTLQSASVVLTPDRSHRIADPRGEKGIIIDSSFSRSLSVILSICAIFGCVLVWQLQRRPSGLVADVKGIAGIAAMANRSHILMDFRDMDTATPDLIHERLKSHRYTLRNSSLAPEEKTVLTQAEKDKYDQHQRHENPHPPMLRLRAGILFISLMFLFMMLIPIILFTSANIITDKTPWLLTLGAVGIKLGWGTLETDVRMMEPFYILSRRHASPRVLTLDYTGMAFGYLPIRAAMNGHWLVALVGLGSVLAEVLTVCVTSFSTVTGNDFSPGKSSSPGSNDSGEETFASFWATFPLAIIILTFLCGVACLVYWCRRNPFLPRQPSSIASVLAFIHQSKMLYDFVGTEKMNNDEMVERLMGIGKRYGLGWFNGRDGELHCGVDEEELLGSYKYGYNAREATMPWTTNWEHY